MENNKASTSLITGDTCPASGDYETIETGEINRAEQGDIFPPYYEQIGETDNGTPIFNTEPKHAHYKRCS